MRFPVKIKHRQATATIYGTSQAYKFYRVAYYSAGKRIVHNHATYSAARQEAEKIVRELSQGSLAPSLPPKLALEAKSALDLLDLHRRETGKQLGLTVVVNDYLAAVKLLGDRPLGEAVQGYLKTVAVIRSKNLSAAVEEFIQSREHKTQSKDGKRPQLNPVYHANVHNWLKEFSNTLPNHNVNDIIKDHLTLYFAQHGELAGKSRNDRRAALKMFFRWCVKRDYLSAIHRLNETDVMAPERVEVENIAFYQPNELQTLLDHSDGALRACIALGGLAGLRGEEIMRLTWEDVWRVEGHIEISRTKSKTRQRRLVPVCDSLAAWLRPFRDSTGPIWPQSIDTLQDNLADLRDQLKIPARRNGLRHAFCSYHFALHSNENLTAAMAGNSPQMIHGNYKGLATKTEAEKWFAVAPALAAPNIIPLASEQTA